MASKTAKSKSDEKPSPELQALYKEYWATKTKFGQQIVDAMEHFGTYSDQVERIQLKESEAISVIYDKIEKQKQKESGEKKAASGEKKAASGEKKAASGSTGARKKSKMRKKSKRSKKSHKKHKKSKGSKKKRRSRRR